MVAFRMPPKKTRSVPKLSVARAKVLLRDVPGWKLRGRHLVRTAVFEDFLTLMDFVNDMAQIAEEEGHHPDFSVHYNKLDIEIWTHAKDGLSVKDFHLAARLSVLLDGVESGDESGDESSP